MIVLKFDTEIKGDCKVPQHEGWITCDSLSWGVARAISTSGVGADRDTSNPNASEVTISKSFDIASNELMRQACSGISLGKATIHFIQTRGVDQQPEVFLEYILDKPIISSYSISSGGERPMESIGISFTKIEAKYTQFKEGEAPEEGNVIGYDFQTNTNV